MLIPEKKWRWFGFAGHFVCGEWCRFHLCTMIGKFVVSTVGKFVHPSKSQGREDTETRYLVEHPNGDLIGINRYYETMVFKVRKICDEKGCNCGQPIIVPSELDTSGYQDAGSATKGHRAMCLKVAAGKVSE